MALVPYQASTAFSRPLLADFFPAFTGTRMDDLMRTPSADVVETDNEVRVDLELPGMRAEDIEVDLESNVLTISGHKREEREEREDEGRTWHLSERRYGRFSRSFVLPREVEQDRIEARFHHGVLHVTVPKSERARRRRIEVQAGGNRKRIEA